MSGLKIEFWPNRNSSIKKTPRLLLPFQDKSLEVLSANKPLLVFSLIARLLVTKYALIFIFCFS